MTYDAAIVGAGIVGAACANALSEAGARVALNRTAAQRRQAWGSWLWTSPPRNSHLLNYSLDLWLQLAPELPPPVEFERRGTLWAAADEEEFAAIRAKRVFLEVRGVRVEVLNESGLRSAEPNLRSGLAGGPLVPDDSVIYAQPRATGQVLIGSSRQFSAANAGVDRWMLERMLSRAIEYMPAIGGLDVIRTWTGFRAATSDSLPIIGWHPRQRNMYLAMGHEG